MPAEANKPPADAADNSSAELRMSSQKMRCKSCKRRWEDFGKPRHAGICPFCGSYVGPHARNNALGDAHGYLSGVLPW